MDKVIISLEMHKHIRVWLCACAGFETTRFYIFGRTNKKKKCTRKDSKRHAVHERIKCNGISRLRSTPAIITIWIETNCYERNAYQGTNPNGNTIINMKENRISLTKKRQTFSMLFNIASLAPFTLFSHLYREKKNVAKFKRERERQRGRARETTTWNTRNNLMQTL